MVEIREAKPGDAEACGRLLTQLSGEYSNHMAVFEALLTTERGRVVVAEEEGVLLGMASVSYNLAMRYSGEYCQLEELIVAPEARGKNVGALLVQRTLDDAEERGCAEYGLYLVEHTEHNRPFYEKFAISAVGTEMRKILAAS